MSERRPTVVIVGGGFGGLAAAKALRRSPVRVMLVDRTNPHLFQPLLYQVATSTLSPARSPTWRSSRRAAAGWPGSCRLPWPTRRRTAAGMDHWESEA